MSQSPLTHHEFFTGFELRFDFPADFAFRDAQVLSDVAVVAHQGHVVFIDVNQLQRVKNISALLKQSVRQNVVYGFHFTEGFSSKQK